MKKILGAICELWKLTKTISSTLIQTKWDRFAIWLANGSHIGLSPCLTPSIFCDILVLIFLSLISDVPHIWKPIYTSGLYFPNYISSSVGLVTINLTCASNNEKKSVKIPEEATMYCKSKKDAANKVKNICYIHCHILIIIPSLNTR